MKSRESDSVCEEGFFDFRYVADCEAAFKSQAIFAFWINSSTFKHKNFTLMPLRSAYKPAIIWDTGMGTTQLAESWLLTCRFRWITKLTFFYINYQ